MVLMPLYYRLNLISIYGYLEKRFGFWAYKTGSAFFLLSRTIGSAARLYLAVNVLQIAIFEPIGVPFFLTVFISIALIWMYTHRGGVKTIIWTDTLQTSGMLMGLIICSIYILSELDLNVIQGLTAMQNQPLASDASIHLADVFSMDVNSKSFFLKQIIGGAFVT